MAAVLGNHAVPDLGESAEISQHDRIHSCHITDTGPALGVHLGPGGLTIGFTPQPHNLN